MRESGILMHISSLPSPYGIGTMGKCAYEFVDFLADSGQSYWQILPLGQTGYGDSPYQSFSTFAGNPYFIDPEALIEAGYIDKKTADQFDFTKYDYVVDAIDTVTGKLMLVQAAKVTDQVDDRPLFLVNFTGRSV